MPPLPPPSEAALRNRGPIADALAQRLPAAGHALEVASGGGVHVRHFAERMPGWTWQPSEADAASLAEIDARAQPLANVRPAVALDVRAPWPDEAAAADAVVCINMIHASPPDTLPALMAGAGRVLPSGGRLFTYGAYRIDGAHTAPSNVSFDAWLKARDPSWGVRDLEVVVDVAASAGLDLVERLAMPANNFLLMFARR